ncbi:DUF1499 domain-containing protein [uncultured Sphingorhabdus sp.]|uniref:DUF1499 domain-containing protein n=1 Tax=uncultured Sphingorhabdus sp. TaxID=1686106 RepID=UPI00261B2617|nr:DUF1499 domain-containing protein [uncultured Sphingorhabdus sp.]HMS19397.1 DUF1499 domain-containing protein [Sphingorhabdus sp.]
MQNDENPPVQSGAATEPVVEAVQQPAPEPVSETAAAAPVAKKSSNRSGKTIFWLGLGSILIALAAGLGSGWGLWDFRFGFQLLMLAFGAGILALLGGFVVGWWAKRKGRVAARPLRWLGMTLGGALALWLLSFAYTARTVPAIHDISTDLADPPQFRMLEVRADNLDQIPGENEPEMKGMNPQQRWAALHQKAYGDIRSVRIAMPVAEAIAKAERLAKVRGWEVAIADPVEGRLEATDTTRFFRFKDDVVVRVRPTEDGTGSIVDMRSISRVGISDLGMNAKRVRSFIADLAGTNPAG